LIKQLAIRLGYQMTMAQLLVKASRNTFKVLDKQVGGGLALYVTIRHCINAYRIVFADAKNAAP